MPIMFLKVEKIEHDNLTFVHLSLFSIMHNSKTMGMHECSTYQTTPLLFEMFFFWIGGEYELQLVSYGPEHVP